jgi:mono/diheme cytochrome c family protein
LIVGLGNHSADNTTEQTSRLQLIDGVVKANYGTNSKEWQAYEPFSRGFKAIGPYIRTSTQGANPADKIFAALSGHRDKNNLTWIDQATYTIPTETIPTDVPAWWLLKKKHALYYNGLGKGDFARLMMASSLLSMKDTAEARAIDNKFPDVVAYLKSLQPPKYPQSTDPTLAQQGKIVFETNCARCHGTYGSNATYPNLLIDLPTIGTDAALSNVYFSNPQYHTWYNESWFNKPPYAAQLLPNKGYVAPPLDGIWATAPYLHNGSVPTLEDLLNSTQRPVFWKRSFDDKDYDWIKLGWKYEVKTKKEDIQTYDTTQNGYGNSGHYFGDKLSATERKALLEYLKTL